MYALVATLGVFALILILSSVKVPLTASILTGAVATGLAFRVPLPGIIKVILLGAIQPDTIALAVITILVLILSQLMQSSGKLESIVSNMQGMLRNTYLAMAALPALIGLLPMPGGALFSAPMVKTAAGDDIESSGGFMSAINYWYRHIWEHWWPLYPGVILAMTLTESHLGTFILFQFPLSMSMAVSGIIIFLLARPKTNNVQPNTKRARNVRDIVSATSPIWIIILSWILTAAAIPVIGIELPSVLDKSLPITVGLVVAVIHIAWQNKTGRKEFAHIFGDRNIYSITVLVLAVMVFQYMLKHTEAAPRIAEELSAYNVPVGLIAIILPFIAGMVTGLAIGFVGTSFPIVLGLLAAMPDIGSIRPYIALAYAFGHLGQMMSPLHLCHIVSNRYFETGFKSVYSYIAPSAVLTGTLALLYFALLKTIL